MPSTTGPAPAKALRLASARLRIRAFLEQISELETADFPHADGREALTIIKEQFRIRERSLTRLPLTVADSTIDEVCTNTGLFVSRYTEVLGFILRSTNVRNAFEVHFPLKRLIQRTIHKDAKLVMSSEWKFVPFTWPMSLPLLEDFVLVGGPAPESGNVLIIPLAGHEIGHSAWRSAKMGNAIKAELTAAIDEAINANPEARDRVLQDSARSGYDVSWLQHQSLGIASKQLEEIFCDMFALYVFGPSFLFAYEYFLAPGSTGRGILYPSSKARVDFLLEGAKALKLEVEPDLFARWQDSVPKVGTAGDVLILADAAVAKLFPTVRDQAFGLLQQSKVPVADPASVDRVRQALELGVPDGDGAILAEIVTAGWLYLRDRGGLSLEEDRQEHTMLNELMLKSVEVSEFKLRVADA